MEKILPDIALGNADKQYHRRRREKYWERYTAYQAWKEGGEKPKELTPEPERLLVRTVTPRPPLFPDEMQVRIKNQVLHQRILKEKRKRLKDIGLAFQKYQQRKNISLWEFPVT